MPAQGGGMEIKMLLNLDIKNAALIEHISLEFENGMTVMTGETGAGKSVIIDSINMIMGARTSKNIVRYGEKKAVFQAVFSAEKVQKELELFGIPNEDDNIVITREISEDGKSVCRINGIISPQNVIREIAQNLINIHGQHDNQALLNPSMHICFLDKFADSRALLEEYENLYKEKKSIENEIDALELDEAEKLRKTDLLSYQVNEIEKANIKPGEKIDLSEQRHIIQNSEKITSALNEAYERFYGGENSAYDAVSASGNLLSEISDLDSSFDEIYQRILNVQYSIDDISHDIYNISSEIDFDESVLDEIEERLNLINELERKYGGSEEKILEYLDKSQKELEAITDSDTAILKLNKELAEINKKLSNVSEKLSKSRKAAGERLETAIEKELSELDMPKVRFIVSIEDTEDFTKNGKNVVEFLISPNPGEPEKKLEKIASGGELSRIMLAVKSILADADDVDTLIFDEIDTGVSGSAARKISLKLSRLAAKKQIICVSHQAQPAAFADNHFYVEKKETENRTVTSVKLLDNEERIKEIARITDGEELSEASVLHAKQMLAKAEEEKNA